MARIARDEETKKETFHEKEEEQLLREKRMFADKETFACDCKRDQRIEERPLSLLLWISLFFKRKIFSFLFHRRSIISLVAGAPPITVLGVIANCSPSATSQAKQKKGQ